MYFSFYTPISVLYILKKPIEEKMLLCTQKYKYEAFQLWLAIFLRHFYYFFLPSLRFGIVIIFVYFLCHPPSLVVCLLRKQS